MRFAVVQFPGSNCDQDCVHALRGLGQEARLVWHQETRIDPDEGVILPGGFSYGDYLRCGAIARFSPIMAAVKAAAERGQVVVGICNGFQILCEAGLLPGALTRNEGLHFRCEPYDLRVETPASRFTAAYVTGQVLRIPIAHGEGCYRADPKILEELEARQQILPIAAAQRRARRRLPLRAHAPLGARATAFCAACSAPTGSGGSAWYLRKEAIRGHERPSEVIREAARGT